MKLHCNKCQRDFTTLSERDKERKFAFHHLQLDKMKCPYCHASNWHLTQKGGGGGWNPFTQEHSDRREPAIIVHPECQPHVSGNPLSPDGLTCNCTKACKSFFNCWTGNVDDGDYVAPLEKSIEERRKEAQEYLAKKKVQEEENALLNLRKILGKSSFGYQLNDKGIYARYGGTTWKLTTDDIDAIKRSAWDTPQTQIMKRTFDNKGVNAALARTLLSWELYFKRKA